MIIALAGRRVDAPDAEVQRFPLQNVAVVRERLRTLFEDKRAAGLVCSAACGADLLALYAAGELGLRRRIILPFDKIRFRETSVVDRPGDWAPLYDEICQAVEKEGGVVVLDYGGDEENGYKAVNEKILDDALSVATQGTVTENTVAVSPGEKVLAVIVWEGESRGEDDVTAQFAEAARGRGIEVEPVLTHAISWIQ